MYVSYFLVVALYLYTRYASAPETLLHESFTAVSVTVALIPAGAESFEAALISVTSGAAAPGIPEKAITPARTAAAIFVFFIFIPSKQTGCKLQSK